MDLMSLFLMFFSLLFFSSHLFLDCMSSA